MKAKGWGAHLGDAADLGVANRDALRLRRLRFQRQEAYLRETDHSWLTSLGLTHFAAARL